MDGPIPSRFAPIFHGLLRIVAALTFMTHGTQKLFAWPVTEAREPVALLSQFGLAGVLETFGGLLMLLGLFTRPVAFVLAGEMAAAYFLAHIGRNVFPILNGGEPAVLFCFIWLFMAAAGPGAFSLDGRRTRLPPS